MTKFEHALTAAKVENAEPKSKDYKLADGSGLHLLVKWNGAKYWRYNYRFNGIWKTLAIGVYPEVSLKEARELHQVAINNLAAGNDPMLRRKEEKEAGATQELSRSDGAMAPCKVAAGSSDRKVAAGSRTIPSLTSSLPRQSPALLTSAGRPAVTERQAFDHLLREIEGYEAT
jgi:Arm DNA-binding domain